jgi:hypothetical protein
MRQPARDMALLWPRNQDLLCQRLALNIRARLGAYGQEIAKKNFQKRLTK